MPFDNKLNKSEEERLYLLGEELNESGQAVFKILCHGYDSYNPIEPGMGNNKEQLQRELAHILVAIDRLCFAGDLDMLEIEEEVLVKIPRMQQYLHYQSREFMEVKCRQERS